MNVLGAIRDFADREKTFDFVNRPIRPSRPDVTHGTILYVEDVTVSFDGFRALNELTLYVNAGELRCIIGPNGAGKTTMMDVITGKTRPDTGTAWFVQDVDLLRMSEPEIALAGIGRKFQKPTVFTEHSVFENLELSAAGSRTVLATLFRPLTDSQRDRIAETLTLIGLADVSDRHPGSPSHAQKQWLEIGIPLTQAPKLLLVDGPVAGMTPQEGERTAELLVSLAGERSVVVVEHDMAFVRSISRTVTVLHEGSVLAEGSIDEVQANPRVVEVYLGAEAC